VLKQIGFERLKKSYAVRWTDDQTGTLTITYNNGKIKKISDYGMRGTHGLRYLYGLLISLRTNQNWH
jgi:hypothetical protein